VADNRIGEAIDAVVGRIAAMCITEFVEGDNWGEYPEIGQYDWDFVEIGLKRLAMRLDAPDTVYDAAYDFLGARADAE
jgi:hypothetical protein